MIALRMSLKKISPEKLLMGSVFLFIGSSYLYNLSLAYILGSGTLINLVFPVTFGIAFSLLFGCISINIKHLNLYRKQALIFIIIIGCFELTQVFINHSELLLTTHFFSASDAQMYIPLALIGRLVYLIPCVGILSLLPTMAKNKKEGKLTAALLSRYVSYISILFLIITIICYLYPELIITNLFGATYTSMATLLWQYVLATSLFAISNLFAYYFLSLGWYLPILFSGVLGVTKIVLVLFFHNSLDMVVQVQIITMTALIVAQLLYFVQKNSIR